MRAGVGLVLVGFLAAVGCGSTEDPGGATAPAPAKPNPDKGGDPGVLGGGGNGDGNGNGDTTPSGDADGGGATDAGVMDAGPPPEPKSGPLVSGLAIQEVAFFQAVKIDVVKGAV